MKFYTYASVYKNKILHIGYKDNKKFVEIEDIDPFLAIVAQENKKTQYKGIYGESLEVIRFNDIAQHNEYLKQNSDVIPLYNNIGLEYQFLSNEYPDEMIPSIEQIRIGILDIEVEVTKGFPSPEHANNKITAITIYDSFKKCFFALSYKDFKHKHLPGHPDKKIFYKKCKDEYDLLESVIKIFENLLFDAIVAHNGEGFDFPYILNRINNVMGLQAQRRLSPVQKTWCNSREWNGRMEYRSSITGVACLDFLLLYKKYVLTPRESYSLQFLATEELGEGKVEFAEYDNLNDLYDNDFETFMLYNITDVDLIVRMEEKRKIIATHILVAYLAKVNYEDAKSPVKVWDSMIYNHLKNQNILIPPIKHPHKFSFPGAYVMEPTPKISDWIVSFDLNSLYPHLQMQYNISPEMLLNETLEDYINELTSTEAKEILAKLKEEKANTNQIKFMEMLSIGMKRVSFSRESIDKKLLEQAIPIKHILPMNVCCAGNAHLFKTDEKGFMPQLLSINYDRRTIEKKASNNAKSQIEQLFMKLTEAKAKSTKEYYKLNIIKSSKHNLQNAIKVLLNSGYGALSNAYFRYNDFALASAVTLSGQLSIRYIIKKVLEKYPIEALASDTDSCYFSLSNVIPKELKTIEEIQKWVDNYCENEIVPHMDKAYQELAAYMNCKENKMFMKREKIAIKGLWTAKKKYAVLTLNSEGVQYAKPTLEVTGLEIVRSSTPQYVRNELKECIKLLLEDPTAFQKRVKDFKKIFFEYPVEKIAFPRSVNNIQKYSDGNGFPLKGCPIHVRGTLLYNRIIKQENLENEFPIVQESDKIRFVYLKEPNPYGEHVFAFVRKIPNQEKILPYVDYLTQYKKTFYNVLENICLKINVDIVKRNSLTNLFKK